MCPINKTDCKDCEYQKEGLCDYPYKVGMSLEEIKQVYRIKNGRLLMSWNYRVIKRTSYEDFYQIHEVYYKGRRAVSSSVTPIAPGGETSEELRVDLNMMLKALSRPVLVEKNGKLMEAANGH